MNQELNLWREKTKGLFNITEYKRFWNYISNLEQDNTMYAQLKDEYEEEIEDLKENNEVLLSSYKAQKDINHQQLSMVIKRDKKIKDLQQENEKLKKNQRYYKNGVFSLEYDKETLSDMVDDYKSRCEKSIEYNNQIIKDTRDFYRPTTDIIYSGDSLIEIATNNINILQNGGEENDKR